MALGCGSSDGGGGDPGGDAAPDADPSDLVCDADRMENVVAGREIRLGDFCDVIELCASDAAQAAAITGLIGDFVCGQEGVCPGAGEVPCQWHTPDDIDLFELERLCEISTFDDAPLMRCRVFL